METSMKKKDFDTNIARSLPGLNEEEAETATKLISSYLQKDSRNQHYMLLSNDIHYYTFFNLSPLLSAEGAAKKIMDFLRYDPFLRSLGLLKYVGLEADMIEIWIGETHFGLFPGDSFIVDI